MGKRIITRRRGTGTSTYRSPSHRHLGDIRHPRSAEGVGKVLDIMHAPGRSAPVAQVQYGEAKWLVISAEGMHVGQEIETGRDAPIELGNTLPIGMIPEGTIVHNIESIPGDGGKFIRAAGAGATVVSHAATTIVQMPSGQFKNIKPECKATIGLVAGSGRREKPYAKAGKKFYAYQSKAKRYFKVKGVAMNALNHPHGGGGHPHVGKPSTVGRNAPPGRKVGRLSPQKKRRE
ncbi:MAG: 50S ribosomal protein L2 [Euryarchaeota archaeon]|nr:50S ribosomal protein L2 [Euryarchaeota archaeon]